MTVEEYDGPYGRAERCEHGDDPATAHIVGSWLITAPQFHPLWTQYLISAVRLDASGDPAQPPPHLFFPEATHELLVLTLDPDLGPYHRRSFRHRGDLQILQPVNVVEQFTAADEEIARLIELSAHAVVVGRLEPEASNGSERIRAAWHESLTKTLAHLRGEPHDR